MTRDDLLRFMRSERYAVQASVSDAGGPQAAVVGIIVTDEFEIFFDTIDSSRKARNLARNPSIALVIGGLRDGDERTVQYEGIADRPSGKELERLQEPYFARFPDGRHRQPLPGVTYLRVRPHMDPLQQLQRGSSGNRRIPARRTDVSVKTRPQRIAIGATVDPVPP